MRGRVLSQCLSVILRVRLLCFTLRALQFGYLPRGRGSIAQGLQAPNPPSLGANAVDP